MLIMAIFLRDCASGFPVFVMIRCVGEEMLGWWDDEAEVIVESDDGGFQGSSEAALIFTYHALLHSPQLGRSHSRLEIHAQP